MNIAEAGQARKLVLPSSLTHNSCGEYSFAEGRKSELSRAVVRHKSHGRRLHHTRTCEMGTRTRWHVRRAACWDAEDRPQNYCSMGDGAAVPSIPQSGEA